MYKIKYLPLSDLHIRFSKYMKMVSEDNRIIIALRWGEPEIAVVPLNFLDYVKELEQDIEALIRLDTDMG